MRALFFIGIALWAFLPGRLLAQVPREVMSIVIYEQEQATRDAFILVTHAGGQQQRYTLRGLNWLQGVQSPPFAENEALIVRVFAEYFAQGWELISVSQKVFRTSELGRQRSFTRYLLSRPKVN